MIARALENVDLPVASTSALGVPLPGLVSSLRPIKRLANQLADEATLLSRFRYKNKNQHKGNGWWRRVVEVDRVINRVVVELGDLLAQFGVDASSKQEIGIVSEHAVVPGLLRLPRATVLVDKMLAVILSASSLLEQLVDSRAFLAFALVLVALVSRLHAITTVLSVELDKAAIVLVRLVKANALLPALTAGVRSLPRELRRHVPLAQPVKPASAPSSALSTRPPSPAPPVPRSGLGADDLGAPVPRATLARSPLPPPPTSAPRPSIKPALSAPARASAPTDASAAPRPSAPRDEPRRAEGRGAGSGGSARAADVGPTAAGGGPASSEWAVLPPAVVPPPPQDSVKRKKKKRAEPGAEGQDGVGGAAPAVKKKKKRVTKAADEIDDIFG